QMKDLVTSIHHLRRSLTASDSPGMRLAAVVIFQERPDSRYLTWLAERLSVEKPFLGYHAAKALLSAARRLDSSYYGEIRDAIIEAKRGLGSAKSDTDQFRMLDQAEGELRRKWDNVHPSDAEEPIDRPIQIFISYTHKDETFRDELIKHLGRLRR